MCMPATRRVSRTRVFSKKFNGLIHYEAPFSPAYGEKPQEQQQQQLSLPQPRPPPSLVGFKF